jgi:hypothetical protein
MCGGQLNPDWVEWLMGWPVGWTLLEPLPEDAVDAWMQETLAGRWWQEEPDVPRTARGIKDRKGRLQAIGNGQVPLCAATAWRLLSERITSTL